MNMTTNNLFKPSVGLLAKLGSLAQHIDEASGEGGHQFDWIAIRSILADPEVSSWLDGMHKQGLLPVKRTRDPVGEL